MCTPEHPARGGGSAAAPARLPPPPPAAPTSRRANPWSPGGALSVGLATIAATTYTGIVDPNRSHAFLFCPLKRLTGLDCPFCGSTRAVHSLVHGRLVDALHHNALFVSSIPFLVLWWVTWLQRDLGRRDSRLRLPGWASAAVLTALVVFGVGRNLPWLPLHWFNSGSVRT